MKKIERILQIKTKGDKERKKRISKSRYDEKKQENKNSHFPS